MTSHHWFTCDLCQNCTYRNYQHIHTNIHTLCVFCELNLRNSDSPAIEGWETFYNFEQQMRDHDHWFMWLDYWRNDNANQALNQIIAGKSEKFFEWTPYQLGMKNWTTLRNMLEVKPDACNS